MTDKKKVAAWPQSSMEITYLSKNFVDKQYNAKMEALSKVTKDTDFEKNEYYKQ